jgi:hypothetical protein
MGSIDRGVRVLIAVTLFSLYYAKVAQGTLGIIFLVVGVVFLLTSLIGFCPLYAPFGINTCRKKYSEDKHNTKINA